MKLVTLRRIALVIALLGTWQLADAQSVKGTMKESAQARIVVQTSDARPYDNENRGLIEIRIVEKFIGDWEGESTVRSLQFERADKSASQVSMQTFRGRLGGRRGTFVLQGAETVENGKITASWTVVPGSGTGELTGLRGEGGFQGEFGKGSIGTLNYWFE